MRAVRYHGRRDLRDEELPDPEAGPGELKLRILHAGICGSDVHEYFGGPFVTRPDTPHPRTGAMNPVVFGHELCGEVVGMGEGVEGFSAGDLIGIEPLDTCGTCHGCRTGAMCDTFAVHGFTRSGGAFCEYTTVASGMAHVIPPDIGPLQGALVEPLGIGLHAVKRTRARRDEWLAVHGAGPIGLSALLGARGLGLRTIAVEPSARRREALATLEFEHIVDPSADDAVQAISDLTDGLGVAASVDAAGVPATLDAALDTTATDGTVVIVAHPVKPLVIEFERFRRYGVSLTTSTGAPGSTFHDVIELMRQGAYPLEGWVDRIGLDELVEGGFEPLGRQEKIKVVIDVA